MAVTKIWKVRGNAGTVIDYADNPEKVAGYISNEDLEVVYTDPVTGKARFALSDIHAGLALAVGYEFKNMWQIQLDARMGITDILNLETSGTYVYPYKVSLLVGYHFQ